MLSPDIMRRIDEACIKARLRVQLLLTDEVSPTVRMDDLMEIVGELAISEKKIDQLVALAKTAGVSEEAVDAVLRLSPKDLEQLL